MFLFHTKTIQMRAGQKAKVFFSTGRPASTSASWMGTLLDAGGDWGTWAERGRVDIAAQLRSSWFKQSCFVLNW